MRLQYSTRSPHDCNIERSSPVLLPLVQSPDTQGSL